MESRGRFFEQVYHIVSRIPKGRVVTYGQIAAHLGDPRKARIVGWAMRACPDDLPWHRVVNAQGGLSTRPHCGGLHPQRELLEEEGIIFDDEGHLDLDKYRWTEI